MSADVLTPTFAETKALLEFAAASRAEAGFGWLDRSGSVVLERPVELWITCRMTHVFAVAVRLGDAAYADLLHHGVACLLDGPLHDRDRGGWVAAVGPIGVVDDTKQAYAHAFVVLAGASATAAGHPRGPELLEEALGVVRDLFWDEDAGMSVDAWDAAFQRCDPYRGLNANMHLLEALLAAHDASPAVTADGWALEAAARIAQRVALRLGPLFAWALPEHFDESWQPLPDLNRDQPADQFRPFGVTIGHLFEWARLLTHLDLATGGDRFEGAARALYERAASAEAVDGVPGFPYTTDFDGTPVVRSRLHWVIAEAMAAATALDRHADRDRWSAFARAHHHDSVGGSWWHELDTALRPSFTVWDGKPDVYHALQALWLPQLWPCISFASTGNRA